MNATPMVTCHTCPDQDGQRRLHEAMCDACKRRLAHHEVDMAHDDRERAAAPDACPECQGTGGSSHEEGNPDPHRGGHIRWTRKCMSCDGSGTRTGRPV